MRSVIINNPMKDKVHLNTRNFINIGVEDIIFPTDLVHLKSTWYCTYYDQRPGHFGYKVNTGAFVKGHSKWAKPILGNLKNETSGAIVAEALNSEYGESIPTKDELLKFLKMNFKYRLGLMYKLENNGTRKSD